VTLTQTNSPHAPEPGRRSSSTIAAIAHAADQRAHFMLQHTTSFESRLSDTHEILLSQRLLSLSKHVHKPDASSQNNQRSAQI